MIWKEGIWLQGAKEIFCNIMPPLFEGWQRIQYQNTQKKKVLLDNSRPPSRFASLVLLPHECVCLVRSTWGRNISCRGVLDHVVELEVGGVLDGVAVCSSSRNACRLGLDFVGDERVVADEAPVVQGVGDSLGLHHVAQADLPIYRRRRRWWQKRESTIRVHDSGRQSSSSKQLLAAVSPRWIVINERLLLLLGDRGRLAAALHELKLVHHPFKLGTRIWEWVLGINNVV